MTESPRPSNGFWRRALGTPSDWRIQPVRLGRPQAGVHLLGPAAMIASVVASWWAFNDTSAGRAATLFGFYMGAVSIILMAWSFVLAFRSRILESVFGGLDSMYRAHRWAGALSVAAMFIHVQFASKLAQGIPGTSESVANSATQLAVGAETMLYTLVALSIVRWVPYRWWRWTHKLLGVPFILASWHFFTAAKPYANGSSWGWWFGSVMVIGTVSYLARVLGRDVLTPGLRYRITGASVAAGTLEIAMRPIGRGIEHRPGQFAVIKVQMEGLREPHVFTIASSPDERDLRFAIRELGDWTQRMHQASLEGATVVVEGPYGSFDPLGKGTGLVVWIAGGVGITPFLSQTRGFAGEGSRRRPTLFYCVRGTDKAMAMVNLQEAHDRGDIELVVCDSTNGSRFSSAVLRERFGVNGLEDAHVAVCGPAGLVHTAKAAARSLGSTRVEQEDFDIRQGFGPDLSREIDSLWRTWRGSRRPGSSKPSATSAADTSS